MSTKEDRDRRRGARYAKGQRVDRMILDLLQKHDALSTSQLRHMLYAAGLCEFMWSAHSEGRLSVLAINARISKLRTSGVLYYPRDGPGCKLRMTVHGEAILASKLLEEEKETT